MAELRDQLLPRKRSPAIAPSSRRPFSEGVDFYGLKKRGQGLRSWIRIDAATGDSEVIEVDKFTIMRRCDLPAGDLRLLDPLFVYPSTILGRERAIVVNLDHIRCIITADEVLLLNSHNDCVQMYVVELKRRLAVGMGLRLPEMTPSPDDLPFEFRALEVALEATCAFLDAQDAELENEAYPLLNELASKISTLNLESVRRLKSRLVALTQRVQKVRDEIEKLMDDDGDMAEMYLTEKKRQMESSLCDERSLPRHNSAGGGLSISAPVSPVSSPPGYRKLDKNLSIPCSRHESMRSSGSDTEHIEELEMLLEAYFVVIDSTLNKLTSLKEYIDDTEDFVNIQLDNVRNQLIKFELLLSIATFVVYILFSYPVDWEYTILQDNVRNQLIKFELLLSIATFVVAIFGVVTGIFGMNFEIALFEVPTAFKWVLSITGVSGIIIFSLFICYFKYKKLMPL